MSRVDPGTRCQALRGTGLTTGSSADGSQAPVLGVTAPTLARADRAASISALPGSDRAVGHPNGTAPTRSGRPRPAWAEDE